MRCPTGEARITDGFDLPARYVIHTVGPVYQDGEQGEPELLAGCYRSSLQLASRRGLRSIAFPAISCGVYGYPVAQAVAVVRDTLRECLAADTTLARVVLVAFGEELLAALTAGCAQS